MEFPLRNNEVGGWKEANIREKSGKAILWKWGKCICPMWSSADQQKISQQLWLLIISLKGRVRDFFATFIHKYDKREVALLVYSNDLILVSLLCYHDISII